MQSQRPTLPRQHSSSAATELPASISIPTDAPRGTDFRLAVRWRSLPRRPRFWPFEPCLVTAVGDDTGSNIASPIGAYEFQVRQKHMNDTHPVWDEQGMLCFKRSGTSGFRVEVLGNGKIWSGLATTRRVLRPLALMRTISTFFMVDVLVFLPHGCIACCCSIRNAQRFVGKTAAAARASVRCRNTVLALSAPPKTARLLLHRRSSRPQRSEGLNRAAATIARALEWQQQKQERQLQQQAERRTFALPPASLPWQDVQVDSAACGGSILLRVR